MKRLQRQFSGVSGGTARTGEVEVGIRTTPVLAWVALTAVSVAQSAQVRCARPAQLNDSCKRAASVLRHRRAGTGEPRSCRRPTASKATTAGTAQRRRGPAGGRRPLGSLPGGGLPERCRGGVVAVEGVAVATGARLLPRQRAAIRQNRPDQRRGVGGGCAKRLRQEAGRRTLTSHGQPSLADLAPGVARGERLQTLRTAGTSRQTSLSDPVTPSSARQLANSSGGRIPARCWPPAWAVPFPAARFIRADG